MSAEPETTGTAADGKADSGSVPARVARPKPRAGRTRRAHWRGELRGVVYRFTLEPDAGVIRVRRLRSRKSKTITVGELLGVLEGQGLLPFHQ